MSASDYSSDAEDQGLFDDSDDGFGGGAAPPDKMVMSKDEYDVIMDQDFQRFRPEFHDDMNDLIDIFREDVCGGEMNFAPPREEVEDDVDEAAGTISFVPDWVTRKPETFH